MKFKNPTAAKLIIAGALLTSALALSAQTIGEVSTAFVLIGSNHKIEVSAFDDPKVQGAVCYLSKAKTGGVTGWMGIAEDTSDASIACRQVGPIKILQPIPAQEEAFGESRSILFKKLRVVRMVDTKRNVLVYLAYSDKLIDGSPKNSISVIPLP
jgi:CreA protein